ncbi:MAG: LemA family protein [Pedobacter sp.]|nr:MAG: LemA family protein [Pedobacter sp.]
MIIVAIIAVIVLIFGISIYNNLIGKKNQVANAFSAIDVMLKKRFELLPNLVETVKQYMQYESETLTKITTLRTQATAENVSEADKLALDAQIGTAVKGLMVNVENYPDLKTNQNFLNLQVTWTESEEQIAAARRNYNSSVTAYNDAVMMFPGNMFAGMLGYQTIPVLETAANERQNISAKDLFNAK